MVCYQSRVGPLEWIGPVDRCGNPPRRPRRQGRDRGAHRLCQRTFRNPGGARHRISPSWPAKAGVPDYLRAATVGAHADFIAGLAGLVRAAPWRTRLSLAAMAASVPTNLGRCGYRSEADGRAAQYPVQLHSLDQGAPHHRGDRLDGGHALSAAAVRLSHRNHAGLGVQRALQGDGAPAAQGHHQSLR